MKTTTPVKVFASIYLGDLLAGVIAIAVDAIHHIYFHWTHGYAIHGWNNFVFWLNTGFTYGIYWSPVILIVSFIFAWLNNLFAKNSSSSHPSRDH